MKYIFLSTVVAILFIACEETVTVDAKQTQPKIVIEGVVTNVEGRQFVKISRSTDFYKTGLTPRVTNAIVTVQDDLGIQVSFAHNPSNVTSQLGYYFPNQNFKGSLGRTYNLTIIVDGQKYEAQEKMTNTMAFDSLTTRINEDEKRNPKVKGYYYQALLYGKEPQGTRDYYLFNYYRNDTLVYYKNTDVYQIDDQLIGEDIVGVTAQIYFKKGDGVRLEALSVSRNVYLYFYDLAALLNSDGGMFSSPPSNPRGNISNGAIGLFQVSAIASGEIQI